MKYKKRLGKEIDPVKLKIKNNKVNNLPEGAIKMQSDSKRDSNKLKEEIIQIKITGPI